MVPVPVPFVQETVADCEVAVDQDCVLFVALFLVKVVPRVPDTAPAVTERPVGEVGPDGAALDVPDAVVDAVLYPLTALLTVIVEDCADAKPDAVISPVEEFTDPDPAVADTYEYVAPD